MIFQNVIDLKGMFITPKKNKNKNTLECLFLEKVEKPGVFPAPPLQCSG